MLTFNKIDIGQELKQFQKQNANAGAIVSFSGVVRPQDASRTRVTALDLVAYSPLTEQGIDHAIEQALERWPLLNAKVMHRVGEIPVADTIVFVATASAHRRAAFEAADFLMDYLKTDAFFWKKEITPEGSNWIEPRTGDYLDAKRWLS